MSKSSLLAGSVGGLIGAVLGGGVMLALRPAPVTTPPPTTAEMRAAFADALGPLLDELRTKSGDDRQPARPRVGPRGAASPDGTGAESGNPGTGPASTTPHRGGTREMPEASDPHPVEPLRPDSSVWTPAPNFERVRELRDFQEDMRVRQRWLFLSERQALAEFGTPTSTYLSENGEYWRYDAPDVETEDEIIHGDSFTLVFSRGRLVLVHD